MTVAEILNALEQITKRARTLTEHIDERPSRALGPLELAQLSTQVSEIARIASLTSDLIEMEGLQLLAHGESPMAAVSRSVEQLRALHAETLAETPRGD